MVQRASASWSERLLTIENSQPLAHQALYLTGFQPHNSKVPSGSHLKLESALLCLAIVRLVTEFVIQETSRNRRYAFAADSRRSISKSRSNVALLMGARFSFVGRV